MHTHQAVVSLAIAYTLVGAFIFTVIVTLGSLVGWIRIPNRDQQRKLFMVILVELSVGCVAFFLGWLDTRNVADTVRKDLKQEGLKETLYVDLCYNYLRNWSDSKKPEDLDTARNWATQAIALNKENITAYRCLSSAWATMILKQPKPTERAKRHSRTHSKS